MIKRTFTKKWQDVAHAMSLSRIKIWHNFDVNNLFIYYFFLKSWGSNLRTFQYGPRVQGCHTQIYSIILIDVTVNNPHKYLAIQHEITLSFIWPKKIYMT